MSVTQESSSLQEQIADLKKIIAEEDKKAGTQAWKRKAAGTVMSKDTQTATEAKASIGVLQNSIFHFEERLKSLKSSLSIIETAVAEDEEMDAWCLNLKLPFAERENLPEPARIRRAQEKENEERAESQARGEWVSLTLNHRSEKGRAALARFYARMEQESGSVITEVTQPRPVVVEAVEIEPLPMPKRRQAWWVK